MKPKTYEYILERSMNKILAALPSTSREWTKTLEPVKLCAGRVLYEPDEAIEQVYFFDECAGVHSFHELGRCKY
jgi:hypothetical protein